MGNCVLWVSVMALVAHAYVPSQLGTNCPILGRADCIYGFQ
jgi:hypothetical protein